jgi:molybdate transport system substrate-binding protein
MAERWSPPIRTDAPRSPLMRRRLVLIVPIALGLGFGSGCGAPKPTGPAPIRVAAASDLQTVMPILISRFKLDTGLDVEPVFGASGQLAQQIKAGGPFDLFLSANRKFVDDLEKDGSIQPGLARPFTRGSLVLAVYELTDPGIKGLADLADPRIKAVAIANPETAPYGAAAKQAIERAGLWEKVRPKLVIAESIRQTLQFVESGNAEVGLVGKALGKAKGVRLIPLPPDVCDPIIQAMGLISKRDEARQFADFLLSDEGQGILRDFGFLSIAPSP